MVCKETAGLEETGEQELTTVGREDIRAGCRGEAMIRDRPVQKSNAYASL
jgi:hypothetical protein